MVYYYQFVYSNGFRCYARRFNRSLGAERELVDQYNMLFQLVNSNILVSVFGLGSSD